MPPRALTSAARHLLGLLKVRPPAAGDAARLAQFRQEFLQFQQMSRAANRSLALEWSDRHPCLDDRTASTGFDRHYVYHTAWAARTLARTRPESHVDIGSYVYFAALVSAFVPMRFFDYRPADLRLDGLSCGHADLTCLPFADGSIPSLSCMHVVEHVGLGRYGDPLDPDGDRKALAELKRVLAPGGDLLLVVPVGRPRVCFNAHRIYAPAEVLETMCGLQIVEFALIPDHPADGGLVLDPRPELAARQEYGCGCFWLRRPA
jgi:SAM-dependent methyltransferase